MSIHSEEYKGFTIELHYDSDVECPIDCQDETSSVIIAIWQRNSTIAGLNPFSTPHDALRHAAANGYEVFKIRGYIHSGVAYSADPLAAFRYPFNCPFDSGFAGFALVKRSEFQQRKKADKGLRQRVANDYTETLSQWANGETYWYEVKDSEGETLDSCGGYIGERHALENAREAADSWVKEAA